MHSVEKQSNLCAALNLSLGCLWFYLAVGKLADIPFRDVNFLRYFGCSNICFLEFLISIANFRLTWRIVAPTRRKIARKLSYISKRIERDIRSHYFCKLPHTNTSTTSFFGWTRSTSCAFLRLAVTLATSCGFLRLDFQLLALRMFLRVNRKNIALSPQAAQTRCKWSSFKNRKGENICNSTK